jgi:hypothetical protein
MRLIDLSDGRYMADSMLKKMKVDKFHAWQRECQRVGLSIKEWDKSIKKEWDKINVRFKSAGLNTDHILAVWSEGQNIFFERFRDNKAWIWPHNYNGSYDEALQEVTQLLQAPLDGPTGRGNHVPAHEAAPVTPTSR